MQPYIHDCVVTVQEGSQLNTFWVFCKNHVKLLTNKIAIEKGRHVLWHGDIIVMRAGKKRPTSVVNMRGRDARLADFTVKE
jgi:hypothetical protein